MTKMIHVPKKLLNKWMHEQKTPERETSFKTMNNYFNSLEEKTLLNYLKGGFTGIFTVASGMSAYESFDLDLTLPAGICTALMLGFGYISHKFFKKGLKENKKIRELSKFEEMLKDDETIDYSAN